ncbi:hypothetical protein BH09MYX1_BH09MYX1_36760 [soil metagenome]
MRLVKKDATSALLYSSPASTASTVTNDVAYDPKTNKLVWRDAAQGGAGWESGKIFASSYSPNGLSPVLVLRVVRLSDGMGWDVPLPLNETIIDALWLDDDHVWLWDKNHIERSASASSAAASTRLAK